MWLCRLAKKLVYGKIRQALGVSKCVVSGGGSLQPHLDEFYEVLDLTVLNGWGLSEVTLPDPTSHPFSSVLVLPAAETRLYAADPWESCILIFLMNE